MILTPAVIIASLDQYSCLCIQFLSIFQYTIYIKTPNFIGWMELTAGWKYCLSYNYCPNILACRSTVNSTSAIQTASNKCKVLNILSPTHYTPKGAFILSNTNTAAISSTKYSRSWRGAVLSKHLQTTCVSLQSYLTHQQTLTPHTYTGQTPASILTSWHTTGGVI